MYMDCGSEGHLVATCAPEKKAWKILVSSWAVGTVVGTAALQMARPGEARQKLQLAASVPGESQDMWVCLHGSHMFLSSKSSARPWGH